MATGREARKKKMPFQKDSKYIQN